MNGLTNQPNRSSDKKRPIAKDDFFSLFVSLLFCFVALLFFSPWLRSRLIPFSNVIILRSSFPFLLVDSQVNNTPLTVERTFLCHSGLIFHKEARLLLRSRGNQRQLHPTYKSNTSYPRQSSVIYIHIFARIVIAEKNSPVLQ